jgi:crotonobetainyl-CoA:carnitine CoA-transferase CaiB-like acyl-CoA transferase
MVGSLCHWRVGRTCIAATAGLSHGAGSFTAVMGIMMALYQRERTGKGMVVDVAMV